MILKNIVFLAFLGVSFFTQTLEARPCRKHYTTPFKPYVESEFTVRSLETNVCKPEKQACCGKPVFRPICSRPELMVMPARPIVVQSIILYPVQLQRERFNYYSSFGFRRCWER